MRFHDRCSARLKIEAGDDVDDGGGVGSESKLWYAKKDDGPSSLTGTLRISLCSDMEALEMSTM